MIAISFGSYAATTGASLLPRDPVAKARVREISEVINAGTQPLQNLEHMKAITASAEGADGKAVGKAAILKGLATLESLVAVNRDERFSVGSHVSMADACLVPQLYNARRFEIDLAPFPRLLAVEAHVTTLPCFHKAHPDGQQDAAVKVA